jgi:glycosyltransferase involved in cell wall biosynthesis
LQNQLAILYALSIFTHSEGLLMQKKIPVSVAIITKNEERDLPRALESAKNFAEIIIVDSFSTDRTLDVATSYNAKIYQHEWPGFAKQKQRAIDYATLPWVLILDADECITIELANEIATAIDNHAYQGYYIPRKNFFLGKWIEHCGFGKDFCLRLFKKAVAQMEIREVHEKVMVDGAIGRLKHFLEHYSHYDIDDYLVKTQQYASLAATQMTKDGRKASVIKIVGKPLYAFIKIYFLKQGFRDGIHGFIIAFLFSYSTFLKYVKLWELQKA